MEEKHFVVVNWCTCRRGEESIDHSNFTERRIEILGMPQLLIDLVAA